MQTPLVLQIEDAQWLDPSSLQTLQELTRQMEAVPFALVITSRPHEDGTPFSIDKMGNVSTYTLQLNRLPQVQVRTMVETVLGGTITDALAEFISTQAEGNPFFIEQITLDAQERGALELTAQGWDILPDMLDDVPFSISQVLIARLDRLTFQVKMVVQQASVLGREFDVRILYLPAMRVPADWTGGRGCAGRPAGLSRSQRLIHDPSLAEKRVRDARSMASG